MDQLRNFRKSYPNLRRSITPRYAPSAARERVFGEDPDGAGVLRNFEFRGDGGRRADRVVPVDLTERVMKNHIQIAEGRIRPDRRHFWRDRSYSVKFPPASRTNRDIYLYG